jgi:branched-chain amino acid transport system permease protein
VVFTLFPFLPFIEESVIANASAGSRFALIAVSLVILIGWVGQISLGHAALVGVGAYMTGWISSGFNIPFPLTIPLAATMAAAVAVLLGVVAVRVRGLFLAVATLIFSWMGSEFLFRQEWFIKHSSVDAVSIGQGNTFPLFDLSQVRTFYFVTWAIAALGLLAAANLRDSKTGRAFFAVQGSEMAAASLGIDVTRYKVMAFAVSGFLAGAAGSLLMTDSRAITPDGFAFNSSLLFVAVAVVGGLRSLGGAVAAGIVFQMLNEVQLRITALNGYLEVFSAGLLAIVLLAYPGGLAGLGSKIAHAFGRGPVLRSLARMDRALDVFLADVTWAKNRLAARIRERLEAPAFDALPVAAFAGTQAIPSAEPLTAGGTAPTPEPDDVVLPSDRNDRNVLVRAQNVTVRFGGLTAVNDVTLEVREGEIVGLIGPNGAGKTVTFNSIAGIVTPTEGGIELYGKDVTNAPVHERAKLGIARTFQVLQLFPALTVFDNLLVATHLHNETDILHHVAAVPRAVEAERDARMRVREIVDLLGLGSVVGMYPGDLPFGTLRMVEVARALVTGLKFIMLDEAASGLDDKETDALVEALMKVRKQLGITILLIEHDVKLVMGVSDYVYVLDRGTLIAEGAPSVVQRDQKVIEAYLGTSGPAAADDEAALEEVGS